MAPTLTLTPPGAEWMAEAICHDLWTLMEAETPEDEKQAKEACHVCPVKQRCGRWVISLPARQDVYGVAAGMTVIERAKVRRYISQGTTPELPKRCTRCGETKDATEFYPRPALHGSARDSRCRTCCAEITQERRATLRRAVAS